MHEYIEEKPITIIMEPLTEQEMTDFREEVKHGFAIGELTEKDVALFLATEQTFQ